MKDITEFARLAATRFVNSQQGIVSKYDLGLQRTAVEELIRAVHYASLSPDEGRFPKVSLMSYRKGFERGLHILFRPALPPTPLEISKLAHAVAPDSHLGCICDNGVIEIAGIHVTTLNEIRELGYSSGRVGNPLRLKIHGPGHIEMSTGGIALIYKAGLISEERLFPYGLVIGQLVNAVRDKLSRLTRGTPTSLPDIFNDLAKAILRLGHGGILIVAKDPKKSQFSSLRETDCVFLQQLLVKYWNDWATLLEETDGGKHMLANPQTGEVLPHPRMLAVASDTSMLEKCIDSIGYLAGMDGAIVLTYECRVGAFNAIITRADANSASCKLVNEENKALDRQQILQSRGARHHAALSYVMNVSDSFAFVISQDGSISAFHNPGDGRVVCELGMRVLE